MSVLIVGADHLGAIPRRLPSMGFDTVHHYRGRFRSRDRMPTIPQETDLVPF